MEEVKTDIPDAGSSGNNNIKSDETKIALAKKEEEIKVLNDKYLRLYAEFENFKKMTAKEQADYTKYANEKIIKDLLPVIDNIERAITHSEETKDFDKMIEGIKLIQKQFADLLKSFGISSIDTAGDQFDPSIHQAIFQKETEDDEIKVMEVTQKGYLLNDRVIRPALVIVSKKKDNGE